MSHKSIDFGLGPPPAASRNRRESAMKHGRTASANVAAQDFGSSASPKASAPLFSVADTSDPFGGFDPLGGEGRVASSSVSQIAGANDPFGFFSGSSGVAQGAGKEGAKEGIKEAKEGKTDKNESEDEEGEESEEESSEEEEEENDDDDDKKKKKKGKSKEGKKKKGEEGDKKKSGKEEADAAIASINAEHQKPRGPPLMKVDVLHYMRKGTPFLKYGTSGYPHFRQFQLSEDNTKIVWFSQAKKLKDTQVEIADIDELRLGQTTPNFQKHKAPELSRSSFSLIYRGGRKTLDLIAKDPNEFRIWTDGLKELIKVSRDGKVGELESLKSLVLDIIVHPGRRSSTEIYDVISGLNADAVAPPPTAEEVAATRPRASSSGNKQMYKDVAKNFLALKRKLTKRKDELRDQQYYTSSQYENMQVIVKRVTESINKINEWFQDGEYPLCDDEIWRASVDLESLKNMMKAVKAP